MAAAGRGGAGGTAGGAAGASGAGGEVVVYVSGSSSTISIFALDLATGALTSRGTAAGGTSPTYLAFNPNSRFLYAGNGGQGRITSFRIEAGGALTSLGDVSTAGMVGSMSYMASVTHVSVHPTGNWVFAAHFDSGHVTVSSIVSTGVAAAPVDVQRPANEAHQIISDAAGRHVFVPCRSGNVIAQYSFDSATGPAGSRRFRRPCRRRPAPARATSRSTPTSSTRTSSTSSTARPRRIATMRRPACCRCRNR